MGIGWARTTMQLAQRVARVPPEQRPEETIHQCPLPSRLDRRRIQAREVTVGCRALSFQGRIRRWPQVIVCGGGSCCRFLCVCSRSLGRGSLCRCGIGSSVGARDHLCLNSTPGNRWFAEVLDQPHLSPFAVDSQQTRRAAANCERLSIANKLGRFVLGTKLGRFVF